jgi:hypothetical protein
VTDFQLGLVVGFIGAFALLAFGMAVIGWADMVASKRAEGGGP